MRRAARALAPLRVGYGAALVLAPGTVLRLLHVRVDQAALRVTRVLGVRHVAQGVLSGTRPPEPVLALGVWVDSVHALTALGLGALDRDRARAGMLDAMVASTWAVLGWRDLPHVSDPGRQPRRETLAVLVLDRVPLGRALLARSGGG